MSAPHNFTQCASCMHSRPVEQLDKDGLLTASREVVLCEWFAQYRAARLARSCTEFKRTPERRAA